MNVLQGLFYTLSSEYEVLSNPFKSQRKNTLYFRGVVLWEILVGMKQAKLTTFEKKEIGNCFRVSISKSI